MGYDYLKFGKGARFLVTGGAGFIGSNLCEALVGMGYPVRCLDNFSSGKRENIAHLTKEPGFELMEGDIRDPETCLRACGGMDFILHQAAWGSVPGSIEQPLAYEEINIKGTLNMLEAARRKRAKRFVYASSSAVYGDSAALPAKEGQEGFVLSPYAFTKKANEEYGRLYAKLYGLETIGLRYFNVFGRRQDPDGDYAAVIPKFIKILLDGRAPTIDGDGGQSRDFTYIGDAIQANLKACLAPAEAAGKAFNIACGVQVYLLDLYYSLCTLLGRNIEPVFGPEREGDIRHSYADISKAEGLLGYRPEYSFGDGIGLAVDWYRENL
jgi:UDP-N-acetylglucosamine 4-epimerase